MTLDAGAAALKHGGMHPELAFESRADAPALADDEVHLWFFTSAATAPREVAAQARRALLHLLGGYAAGTTQIACGAHGKPFAPQRPELEFNLSHAGPHVALAFARHQPLGVDLERRDRRVSPTDLAQRFFAPAEAQALQALAPAARATAFLRLWTHKEAVLKALGAGLSFGLERVEFGLDNDSNAVTLRRLDAAAGALADWRLRAFEPAPGVLGALAWRGPPRTLRGFSLSA